MVAVIGMTRRFHAVETTSVPSDMKREFKVGNRTRNLEDLLLGAIDETLRHVFADVGAKVIYNHIENKYHLKKEEIAKKPETFSIGLEKLLSSAAPVIEKMILKNLYSRLELKFAEKKDYEFSDYIKELRKRFEG